MDVTAQSRGPNKKAKIEAVALRYCFNGIAKTGAAAVQNLSPDGTVKTEVVLVQSYSLGKTVKNC